MLRRLRRHMALLNAAISGAILLAMALVALSVSDRMLVRQYERDLETSASSLWSVMSQPMGSGKVAYATKDSLTMYYESGDQKLMAGEAAREDQDALTQAVEAARAQVEQRMGGMGAQMSIEFAAQGDIMFHRVLVTANNAQIANPAETGLAAGEDPVSITITSDDLSALPAGGATAASPAQTVSLTMPNLLVDAGGKAYRVAATLVNGQQNGMLLMFQDRQEELAARARMRFMFFGCAMGGLLLVGAASLFLSKRATRPVEASIQQQHAFVAAASHELRTPVAALRANAEVLGDAELGSFAPFAQSIEQESARLGHLVNDLISLARADAGALAFADEIVDVQRAAQCVVDAMRPLAARKGIELRCDLAPASIRGDDARLRQALVALVDNALRYTPEGGHARVDVAKEKQRVLVSVTDDGPGIPDEHKPHIFDRFYRVDPARAQDGGSGLGLSVTRQIVERMRGTITLRDAEGGGCVFQMQFKPSQRKP